MPNIEVKLRRGTTSQHTGFTGAEGEVTVDTDKDTVVVHDGSTAGGHELRRKDDTIAGSEIDNDAVGADQLDESQAYVVTGLHSNGANMQITRAAEGPGVRFVYDAVTDEVRDVFVDSSGAFQFTNVSGGGTQGTLMTLNDDGDLSVNGLAGIGMSPDAANVFGSTTFKAQVKDGAFIENETGIAKLKLLTNKTGGGSASITLQSTTAPATDEGHYSVYTGGANGKFNITNESTSKTVILDKQGAWYPADDYNASTNPNQALGQSANRWSVIYANSSVITTSDRNEKEEIEDLSEAELRVATAIKGLIKKFKFKGRVRKHIGVIAQDVEAAFTAEGLNASEYGLFCSDTFEDENGVTNTRLGIRYEELLAFVIAVM